MQLPAQFAKIQGGYWIDRPPLSRLLTLLIVYVANTPLPRIGILVALVIALSAVIIGLLQTVRHVSETNTFAGLWLFHLSFVPPLLLFLFSQWRPVYVERALLPSGGIFCIWLAWVLTCTTVPPIIRNLLLASLFVTSTMGIYAHLTYKEFPYGSFQALDGSLQERLGPHDLIVHSNKLTFLPSLLYNRHLPQTFIADPPGSNIDTLSPATQKTLGIEAQANIQSATKGVERVWYIIYQQSIDEFVARGKDTYPDLDYLTSNYTLASQETWDSIQVYLFTSEQ
jgi:hypothetical protein